MHLAMPVAHTRKSRSRRVLFFIVPACCIIAGIIYWLAQGHITLDDARLLHADTQLTAPVSGRIIAVDIKPGQYVHKGDPLFSYDPQPLHDELAKASAELAAIAATLPPDVLRQLAQPQGFPLQQTLEESLDLRRNEEAESLRNIETLSTAQARAVYEYNRIQARLARGRATQEQAIAAQDARQKADAALKSAKAAFEKTSLARAAVDEKLQQLRMAAQRTGTANMPVFMRIKAYEGQLATVRAIQTRFANATVRSPVDGVVTEFFFASGASLTAGQPYMKLGVVGDTAPLIIGYSTAEKASRIKKGQSCKVNLPNVGTFTGVVESTSRVSTPPFPPLDGADARVPNGYCVLQIRLDAVTTYEIAAQPELSLATVTVILRD